MMEIPPDSTGLEVARPIPRTLDLPRPGHSARPPGRASAGGLVVGVALLLGLGWLTFWQATNSKALEASKLAEARGDYPAALVSATDHLARRPWSREASRIAARCLSRLDFADQAEPFYRAGGDLTVEDLRYRAYGLTRANLRERALAAFDEILARDPGDVASLRLRAGLLMSMNRWYDVEEVGQRLSKRPGRPIEVESPIATGGHWTFRPRTVASVPTIGATLEAIACHNRGEAVDAVPIYERVLALDPDLRSMPLDPRLFWSQFGEDLLSVGRSTDLIQLLSPREETRSDPSLLALLARARMQLGQVDESEAAWRKVLELSPAQPSAWLALGRIEAGRGRTDEAIRLLIRAAALAPDSVGRRLQPGPQLSEARPGGRGPEMGGPGRLETPATG